MNEKYIEDFFDCGKIMLTTYERCRNHEDSVRRDEKEGSCHFHLTHGNMAASGIHTAGTHSYMFCGSTIESSSLMEHFSTDNYFLINDVIGFADAISRYIPGFIQGKFGCCVYKDERNLEKNTNHPVAPDATSLLNAAQNGDYADIEKEFYRMQQVMYQSVEGELADEAYFVKEQYFAKEYEFRIIWQTSKETFEPLHIQCPEAIKFCSPGKPLPRQVDPPKQSSDGRMTILSGFTSHP